MKTPAISQNKQVAFGLKQIKLKGNIPDGIKKIIDEARPEAMKLGYEKDLVIISSIEEIIKEIKPENSERFLKAFAGGVFVEIRKIFKNFYLRLHSGFYEIPSKEDFLNLLKKHCE